MITLFVLLALFLSLVSNYGNIATFGRTRDRDLVRWYLALSAIEIAFYSFLVWLVNQ